MRDSVESLIRELQADVEIQNAHFSSNFVNGVGEIFERDGFGATEAYLIDKQNRPEFRSQAAALLKALERMRDCPPIVHRRAIGRVILKALPLRGKSNRSFQRGEKRQ
jgi:hypothetical protein